MSRVSTMASTVEDPMRAPILQEFGTDLGEYDGIVVRQVTQYSDVIAISAGISYEAKNKYQVFALPPGKTPPSQRRQEGSWYPTADELRNLDEIMFIQEESSFCNRVFMTCIGCLNLRPLKLHFQARGVDQFVANRPYKLGGTCGCPLEMEILTSEDISIGRVIENFSPYGSKCFEACCKCTSYTSVLPSGSEHFKYTLRRSNCCCGRVNNCCGATCLNETLIVDILDENQRLIGTLTRYFAPGKGGEACCRAMYGFVNFSLKFPENTSAHDRMLLLSAMMAQEYQFSREGGDNDG